MSETFTLYPFEASENRETIESMTRLNMQELLENPLFQNYDRDALLSSFDVNYAFANMLFNEEEELRQNGIKGANLYYHGRAHAVQQVTYDAISITQSILNRSDVFSNHLSAEGALSIIFGSMFHDSGYVSDGPVENYAARTPIHVEESIKMYRTIIELNPLPKNVDKDKIIRLGQLGIHATNFPFTRTRSEDKPYIPSRQEEADNLMQCLTPEEKKEAQIVRLSVQLADLGGQCARKDYFPVQVLNLRRELEAVCPGSGIKIIGDDNTLAPNREYFLDSFVLHKPNARTVGTTARAFLGEENSQILLSAWKNNLILFT